MTSSQQGMQGVQGPNVKIFNPSDPAYRERLKLMALSRPWHLSQGRQENVRRYEAGPLAEEPRKLEGYVPLESPGIYSKPETVRTAAPIVETLPTMQTPLRQPVATAPLTTQPIVQETRAVEPIRAVQQPVMTERIMEQPIQPQPIVQTRVTEPARVIQQPMVSERIVEQPIVMERPIQPQPIVQQPQTFFQAPPLPRGGELMRSFYDNTRTYRFFRNLQSILDPGCQVYSSRGWGYVVRSPDELGRDAVEIKLDYVEQPGEIEELIELPLSEIEYAAYCSVGNCLHTSFGTGILTDYYRDTDTHVMRLGGTEREQEGNHVDLQKTDIFAVIPSAVGMLAETTLGRGEVRAYDHNSKTFAVLILGDNVNVMRQVNDNQIWTPLAKFVPAAEIISYKGTLSDWKTIFNVIFGNLNEAKERTMNLSREYLGLDEDDLRGRDVSARQLFDKIHAKLQEMANDEQRSLNFQEEAKNNFQDLLYKTRADLEEQTSDEMNTQNIVNKFRELFLKLQDAANKDPELQRVITDFQERPNEMFHSSLERYGTTLTPHEQHITDLWNRIMRFRTHPQQQDLMQIGNDLYGQLASPELYAETKSKARTVYSTLQQKGEEKTTQTAENRWTYQQTMQAILDNLDKNRGDFNLIFDRFENPNESNAEALHDLTVLIRRTFNVNSYGQFLGERVGQAFKIAAFATKGAEKGKSTQQGQQATETLKQAQGQLNRIASYFRETFMGTDEYGNPAMQAPELEEVLYAVFAPEERARGYWLNGQDLRDRFANPQKSYSAATDLMKVVLCQSVERLDDSSDTYELKKLLRKISSEPLNGQDVMDLIVLVLQLRWVAPQVPKTLDTIEQVLRRVENISENETLRAAILRSKESGVHQKLLEDFRGIDEELLRRVAETGGADPQARQAILDKFVQAVVDFLGGVLPNTPLPDVYQANPQAEVAVGNMRIRDWSVRKDNVIVQLGGKLLGSDRPNTVNSLPDDTVFSLKTRNINTSMSDVVWKVRQLTFPWTRAHGLADADINDLSLNLGFKLVRVPISNLRAIERISGKAFGGVGESSFGFGNQAPEAALRSDEGDHVMFILKHGVVDIGHISINLHGSTRAAMLDTLSSMFSNAIRDAIRRQINNKMRENSAVMTGPMNQGLHATGLKLFIEQILRGTIDDVPFITEGELWQMRLDAEAYKRSSTRTSQHDWEESMREHSLIVERLSDLELEVETDTRTKPAAGAWRGGGFVKVVKVEPNSAFSRLLEQRNLEKYFNKAVIVEINNIDVRAKTPDETVAMLREAARPLEIKFALDAKQWRRYVASLGPEAKDVIHDVEAGKLQLTKARLQGAGRLEVQRDRYMERAYVLTNYDENELMFANPLFRMKTAMLLYSVNGEILLGREYEEAAAILNRTTRPAMLMLLESPVKDVVFLQAPTDMVLAEKNGKIYIADFQRQQGVIRRASSEIREGDELFDLDGRAFPGPYGYHEDLRRLRRMHAPATLGVGRWLNSEYKKFDVRITEDGMIDAIFGEGANGRPYIKGFTDVPGPGAANGEVDRGYIILGINGEEFDRFITPGKVEELIETTQTPFTLRVLDTKLFKQIVRARDNEIPLVEAA